jgi:hypothetical protein
MVKVEEEEKEKKIHVLPLPEKAGKKEGWL